MLSWLGVSGGLHSLDEHHKPVWMAFPLERPSNVKTRDEHVGVQFLFVRQVHCYELLWTNLPVPACDDQYKTQESQKMYKHFPQAVGGPYMSMV